MVESLKEKEELKKVMEKYDAKLARLKGEIYTLQDDIEDRDNEIEELKTKIKVLKKNAKHNGKEEAGYEKDCKCEHTQGCEHQHDKEINKETDEKPADSELQQVIDDMTEECEMQQDRIDKLEEELEERDTLIENLKHQIQDFENLVNKFQPNVESDDGQERIVEDLNCSINEKECQIEEMANEKQELQNRIADLEKFISEQDLELPVEDIEGVSPRSANSALRILKTQYLRLRNEHTSIAKVNALLQEENSLLKKEMEITCVSDEDSQPSHAGDFQRQDEGEQNEEIEDDNIRLSDGQRRLQVEQDAINNNLAVLNKIEELPEDVAEALTKEYEKQVSDLKEELKQYKAEIDRLTMIKNEMTQERGTMMEYMHLVRVTSADLDKQNNELTQNVQMAMKEKMELQKRVEDLQLELGKLKHPNNRPEKNRVNTKQELTQNLQMPMKEKTELQQRVQDHHQLQKQQFPSNQPEISCALLNRVNTKVRDLVKFHESKVEIERDPTSKTPRPRLEQWPSRTASVSKPADNDMQFRQGITESSPELNTKVFHVITYFL